MTQKYPKQNTQKGIPVIGQDLYGYPFIPATDYDGNLINSCDVIRRLYGRFRLEGANGQNWTGVDGWMTHTGLQLPSLAITKRFPTDSIHNPKPPNAPLSSARRIVIRKIWVWRENVSGTAYDYRSYSFNIGFQGDVLYHATKLQPNGIGPYDGCIVNECDLYLPILITGDDLQTGLFARVSATGGATDSYEYWNIYIYYNVCGVDGVSLDPSEVVFE